MLPIVQVPETISQGMLAYHDLFCKEAGFDQVCRYVSGLILSPNKTLEGIHDFQVRKKPASWLTLNLVSIILGEDHIHQTKSEGLLAF